MFPICLPRLADKLFQAVLLERVKKAPSILLALKFFNTLLGIILKEMNYFLCFS